jgi:hypothetical protein
VNGADHADGSRLLREHTVLVELRNGDSSQDEDDRDHDQKFNEREASLAAITCHHLHVPSYYHDAR